MIGYDEELQLLWRYLSISFARVFYMSYQLDVRQITEKMETFMKDGTLHGTSDVKKSTREKTLSGAF